MKDPQQKVELYACLCMMMNEETPEKLNEREELYCTGKMMLGNGNSMRLM